MSTIEQIINEFELLCDDFDSPITLIPPEKDGSGTPQFTTLREKLRSSLLSYRTSVIEECVEALDKSIQASGCHCESHESEAEDIMCVKRREEVMEILRATRTRLNSLKEKTQ